MPSSQRSFDTRANRFSTANDLIQAMANYNSSNQYTSKAGLNAFVIDVNNANVLTATTLQSVDNLRADRRLKSFRILGIDQEVINPSSMEMRIEGTAGYLKSDFGADSGAYKAVKSILKSIRPKYKKKAPGAPRGAGVSPMEKSFLALVGQADAVIAIISALPGYNPPNPDLSIANMQNLASNLRQLNTNIVSGLKTYGDANRARKKIFDSKGTPPGMDQRIIMIKNYLASFPGGKKSNEYIEFSQAIKGT